MKLNFRVKYPLCVGLDVYFLNQLYFMKYVNVGSWRQGDIEASSAGFIFDKFDAYRYHNNRLSCV